MLIFLALLVFGGLYSFYYFATYDEGIRAGFVLRLSKKGMMFKTYEGQLNLQSFGSLKGTSPIAEVFDFSVEKSDTLVVRQLQEVALSGERVNLHYIKRYKTFPWRGDTKYFIKKVERMAKPANE
ncbi:MAG: 6-phosphogluconate dehydrogenase [Flammeovirgaceae bacterium]|nr:6-phosphogluconate dehydrogenase [Flammeovirgaceae bacterium]